MVQGTTQRAVKRCAFALAVLIAGGFLARQGHAQTAVPGVSSASTKDAPVVRFVRNPDPAPPLTLRDLDGKPLSLDAWHGKVALINFWATWCPPCRVEIPDLIALQRKYAGKLQVVGLSVDDAPAEDVRKFVAAVGINYPVALAPPEVSDLYGGVAALPTSFLVDTEGRVVQKHVGLHDPGLYETEIRSLLGLPVRARVETFEDTGEIFLRHADRATDLPGVEMSVLTLDQRRAALRRFNAESCPCPCRLTLAQCRVNDSACPVSKSLTEKIVSEISLNSSTPKDP